MPFFILATKVSSELTKDLSQREELGKKWLKKVKEKCPKVKFHSHYAVLGPYDFIDIFEAPDEEVAMKVSMLTLNAGAEVAESWTAIPYKRFLELLQEISD